MLSRAWRIWRGLDADWGVRNAPIGVEHFRIAYDLCVLVHPLESSSIGVFCETAAVSCSPCALLTFIPKMNYRVTLILGSIRKSLSSPGYQMAQKQMKSARIRPGQRPECPLFSPKQTFARGDSGSVRMSAFGQKQSFRFYARPCILTVNGRLLSAISSRRARSQHVHSERPLSRTKRKYDSAPLSPSLKGRNGQQRSLRCAKKD